jgi:hypothetical protein
MNSREIILANLEHNDAPRCGMNFGNGRLNDFLGSGVGAPAGYTQKRWTEGNKEYYDDIWGNLWMRMVDGCQAGEVVKPAIEDWSQLDDYQPPVNDLETATNNVRNGYAQFSCAAERFKPSGSRCAAYLDGYSRPPVTSARWKITSSTWRCTPRNSIGCTP